MTAPSNDLDQMVARARANVPSDERVERLRTALVDAGATAIGATSGGGVAVGAALAAKTLTGTTKIALAALGIAVLGGIGIGVFGFGGGGGVSRQASVRPAVPVPTRVERAAQPPQPVAPIVVAVPRTAVEVEQDAIQDAPNSEAPRAVAVTASRVHPVRGTGTSTGTSTLASNHDSGWLARTATVRASTTQATPDLRPTSTSTSDEAALLFRARAALRAGHTNEAQDVLAQYRARFANGQLAEESASLGVELAVERMDAPAAHAAFDDFVRRFPSSVHRARLARALEQLQRPTP